MTMLNLSQKIVTDDKNSFFRSNKIIIADSIPTSGSYMRGDLIVNSGDNNEVRCMWICTESGTPGKWSLIGSSLITTEARVTVNNAVSDVPITGLGGIVEQGDKLDVFLNSVHLLEGVDYVISADGSKISKVSGMWNVTNETAVFDFVLFKQVEAVDGDEIVIQSTSTKTVAAVGKTSVIGPQTSVVIPSLGYNSSTDSLLVFKNGMIMIEGIDYQVSNGRIVTVAGPWNEANVNDYEMIFVVLKEIIMYDSSVIEMQTKQDGSLATDAKTIVGAINELKAQIDALNAELINKNAIIQAQNDLLNEQRLQGIAAVNSLLDEL